MDVRTHLSGLPSKERPWFQQTNPMIPHPVISDSQHGMVIIGHRSIHPVQIIILRDWDTIHNILIIPSLKDGLFFRGQPPLE